MIPERPIVRRETRRVIDATIAADGARQAMIELVVDATAE